MTFIKIIVYYNCYITSTLYIVNIYLDTIPSTYIQYSLIDVYKFNKKDLDGNKQFNGFCLHGMNSTCKIQIAL